MSEGATGAMDPGRLRGLVGAIAYITLVGVSIGLAYPLLSIILERQGESGLMIGSSATAQALGAIAITPFMPALMRWAGMAQLLVVAATSWILGFYLLWQYVDPWAWMPIRFVLGAMGSIAFFGSEFWIVALAPKQRRGRIVAVYAASVTTGFGIGPLLLALVGFGDVWPFVVGGLAVLLATIPVVAVRRHAPYFTGEVSMAAVPKFALLNPIICLAVLLFGVLEAGIFGLLPVWGVRAGLEERIAAVLVALAGFGSVVVQLFIGPASDRMNRSLLLTVCAAASAVLTVLVAAFVDVTWVLWLSVLAWGGFAAGLYTVALVELGGRYSGRELAVGSAAVIMGYGLGAVIGPLVAGAAMDAIPPHGMLYSLAVICAFFAVYTGWSSVRSWRTPGSSVTAVGAGTSPAAEATGGITEPPQ